MLTRKYLVIIRAVDCYLGGDSIQINKSNWFLLININLSERFLSLNHFTR